jgi:methylated-DNA-[protein]-cysteine S-methyltransferase
MKTHYASPIGTFTLEAEAGQLIALMFDDTSSEASLPTPEDELVLDETKRQLDAYFAKQTMAFSLPLAPRGTAFQRKVWEALCAIPSGETRSYGAIATSLGTPNASRAVGGANHVNPIAIIIPCHRVIGSSGKLVGYAGGLDRKEWLLAHERGLASQLALLR